MSVLVIGLSHRSSTVEVRERLAFAEEKIPGALQSLRTAGIAEEAVILSTCNRVEIYAAAAADPARAFPALKQFLTGFHAFPGELDQQLYALAEPHSLQHLFKVAGGLDSMALGETEILGQLKKAYDLALRNRHTGAKLNKAFQLAFNTAKRIRTATNIQRGSISIASVAVELAERIFSSLAEHEALVIGAGDTSEKTARALASRGVRGLIFTNRSPERAQALAQELGGRTVPFADWPAQLEHVDIAISSTSAPHFILDKTRLEPAMKRRRHRPLLLIDIAVPRDIDPEVNFLEDVYLYNVDDLQAIANDYLKSRKEEIARCEEIIAGQVAALLERRQR